MSLAVYMIFYWHTYTLYFGLLDICNPEKRIDSQRTPRSFAPSWPFALVWYSRVNNNKK